MNRENKGCCHNKEHECCHNRENREHECCHNRENREHECCHNRENREHECCHNKENGEHECCHKHQQKGHGCHKKEDEGEDEGNHHKFSFKKIFNKDNLEYDCCGNKIIKEKIEYDCCGNKVIKHSQSDSIKKDIIKRVIFLIISLIMLILSYINIWKLVGLSNIDYLDFGYIAIILCGTPIFINAIRGLIHKKINSSLLVSSAIIASIILEIICRTTNMIPQGHLHSYIFAAGEISFLMALGSLIEVFTVKSSRKGIEDLLKMSPKTANLKYGNKLIKTNIENIQINDIVVVKPNEMIPVDGVIISGASAVDQSNITGEFVLADVKENDKVYAGTFNKMGVIEVLTTTKAKDNTVNKMIHLALEAEENKAPIVRIADKWASYIVPCALLLSLIVGLICYYAFNLNVIDSIIRAVTILVVFCPCSLTLAAPTAVAAGIGSGARNGIIIKNGEGLEKLASVDTIAFDKTGTITTGNIQVKDIISFNKDYDLLQLTASIEQYSEHPIGKAIVDYSKNRVQLLEPKDVISKVGIGISAKINNKLVETISYKEALNQYGKDENLNNLETYLIKGYTVVVTIFDGNLIGAICLYDTIRNNAKFVVNKINEKGINTLMLTGDSVNSANNIAKECNIKTVKASLMPEEKLNIINDLKKANHNVCMVGDGVNDAPALASSNCSIAMTNIGNDIAIETSDIAIMNKDITNVLNALELSKKTFNTIKRNIIISMSINAIAVILSLFGYLTPITGAIVHNCTSIFVVVSSALILRTKYIKAEQIEYK